MRIDFRDLGRDEVDKTGAGARIRRRHAEQVRMAAAGHLHFFQAVDFGAARPPQLVVGTGGDNLSVVPPVSMVGADINGLKVVNSVTYAGFAYMVWDRLGALWTGTLFDVDGRPINRCRLFDRSPTSES
jgi:hypothetical protein